MAKVIIKDHKGTIVSKFETTRVKDIMQEVISLEMQYEESNYKAYIQEGAKLTKVYPTK